MQENGGAVVLTVRREGDLSRPASVFYATADVTASDKKDYIYAAGTLSFAPGEEARPVTVLITDDAFKEQPDETFDVELSRAAGATLDPARSAARVTIVDDDPPEQTLNPNDRTANFVAQHYNDFLNRQADDAGLAFWSQGIEQYEDAQRRRDKRIDTSAAFFLSIEFQETGYLVYRLYKAAYGNLLDKPVPVRFKEFVVDTQEISRGVEVGAPGWFGKLEANKAAFGLAFVHGEQFLRALPESLSPREFVNALNGNVGRILSEDEIEALVLQLSNNNTRAGRADVLRRVADHAAFRDAEQNRAFVLMQYFGYLRRDPDDVGFNGQSDPNFEGFNFWLTKLNGFGGDFRRAEMVKAFIESIEYRQRFGQ